MSTAEGMFAGISGANRKEIFRWWEARRFKYNLLIGLVGALSWILVVVIGQRIVEPGEDFVEPLMLFAGPVLYAVMANLCYTAGPLFDITFYRRKTRVALFQVGLVFSLLLTASPGVWSVLVWCIMIYAKKKL